MSIVYHELIELSKMQLINTLLDKIYRFCHTMDRHPLLMDVLVHEGP